MPLNIVRNDITTMKVDAIVNAANESLLGGGGVDGAIHHAAGPELLAECRTLGGCKTGQAKITKGYRLPAKFVIHTVGPIWQGGSHMERKLLVSAYRSSLEVALAHQCETVAFPLISSGVYGYPKDQALKVAVDTIGDFLLAHDMTVYLVIFDRTAYTISGKLFSDIAAYIDDRYVDAHTDSRETQRRRMAMASMPMEEEEWMPAPCTSAPFGLDEALSKLDESFSQMLLRKIDECGMTDAQCYPEEACSEQRVREDISILQALSEEKLMAFELTHETGPHNQRRYKLYHPTFGLNEARMVFDSISISQFLSQSQKNSLISQLEGFLSHSEVQQLKQRVRVRPCLMQNEMLPQTLQVIYRAIDERKCLCFDYTKFDLKGRQQIRKTYRHIRPIQVVWEQEHYYLVAINPEHAENDQQRNYRIDRMRNVVFDTGKWKRVNALGFSYGQFDMFSSKEKRTVKFRVHQDLLDMVFETFGTHIICHPDDERQEWIVFSAEVELSGGFDRWVLRQTDKIEVLAPPSVRNRIDQLLQNIIASYRE